MARLDNSSTHLALQAALRTPETWRLVPFFAPRQAEWNLAVVRALEAAVRSIDERDRWLEELDRRLRASEEKVAQLETELRGARAAEDDARRKLATLGVRLRDIEERLPRSETPGPA